MVWRVLHARELGHNKLEMLRGIRKQGTGDPGLSMLYQQLPSGFDPFQKLGSKAS